MEATNYCTKQIIDCFGRMNQCSMIRKEHGNHLSTREAEFRKTVWHVVLCDRCPFFRKFCCWLLMNTYEVTVQEKFDWCQIRGTSPVSGYQFSRKKFSSIRYRQIRLVRCKAAVKKLPTICIYCSELAFTVRPMKKYGPVIVPTTPKLEIPTLYCSSRILYYLLIKIWRIHMKE